MQERGLGKLCALADQLSLCDNIQHTASSRNLFHSLLRKMVNNLTQESSGDSFVMWILVHHFALVVHNIAVGVIAKPREAMRTPMITKASMKLCISMPMCIYHLLISVCVCVCVFNTVVRNVPT